MPVDVDGRRDGGGGRFGRNPRGGAKDAAAALRAAAAAGAGIGEVRTRNDNACTGMVEKVVTRLRDLIHTVRGSQDAGSRSLGPDF